MITARLLAAAALAAVASTTALGCSSSGSSSKSTTTTSTKTFHLATSEGQVSVSLDGKLPPNWPSGFPVPSDAKPAGSGSLGGSSKTVLVGVYTVSGSAQQAYDFYKNNSQLTVESASSVGAGKAYVGTVKLGGTYSGVVTVATIGDSSYIVAILKTAGATSTTNGATSSSAA